MNTAPNIAAHLTQPEIVRRDRSLVLTVDDEPCISRVIELKLQNAGYDVVRASTGIEGYQKFVSLRPDVIISDVRMPGMTGLELLAHCETHRSEWQFLTILLTSQLDDAVRNFADSPTQKYLAKPFSPKEVLHTVAEYIHARSSARGEEADT